MAQEGQQTRDGITYELDLLTGDLQWSEALYSVMQYSHAEPFNRLEWWAQHVHPDDAMTLNQALDGLIDPSIANWTVSYRFRRGDGAYVPVRDTATIVRDEQGAAVKITGTLTPAS
jgi:PAS domain-containing protein